MGARAFTPSVFRYRVFILATETACCLNWIRPITLNGKTDTKIAHFGAATPNWVEHMRIFGEAGVVTLVAGKKLKSKVEPRGVTCLMGGYSKQRAADCYRMYDPITNTIYETRDVLWLGRMYFPKPDGTHEDLS